ncbi:restriction endonuclease subunit S [Klebsiella pneumoniae]|nr:restriction endonuclease subunit S [Klebsiella oxytoca]HEI8899786.1 restriction endonuclease subunit S [Klebsiella aerogenes]
MSSNWPIVRIDDIKADRKNAITIGPFGSRMKSDCYTESGIAVIRGTNLGPTSHFINDFVYITEEKADELTSCNVYKNDLVFPHRGSIGEVGIVEHDQRYVLSSSLMKLTCATDKACPKFVYYFFKSSTGRHELLKNASQVGTPGIGQPLSSLKSIELSLPPLRTQENIAKILSSLDEKIHINQKINQTLEQMAQALFKSWFVDYEPVKAKIEVLKAGGSQENATLAAMTAISGKDADSLTVFEREHPEKYAELKATAELFPSVMQESELGEIPEGWAIDNLGTIIEFNPKRILKKGINAPYLDMKNVPVKGHSVQEVVCREVTSGTKFKNGDTLLARITPCLENGKTAFVDFLSSNDTVGWGSTEFIVMRIKRDLPLSLSYFIARLESFRIMAIQSMQGTSGRQRADAGVLQNMPWVIPPDALLVEFGKFSNFVIDNNRIKHNQNTLLSQLRDTLLPKLLSGEITLPEAEELAKEADYV